MDLMKGIVYEAIKTREEGITRGELEGVLDRIKSENPGVLDGMGEDLLDEYLDELKNERKMF
jgi:hypothetical protein